MVGVQREFVIRDEVSRNRLAVVRLEQFCGCMPQLSRDIRVYFVESVFKLGVALAQEPVEGGPVFYIVEVEWLAGAEDSRVFGEVTVMWVVEAVYTGYVREEMSMLGSWQSSPSMNSRVSILTWRGRSRRCRRSLAVTVGYDTYSRSMFLGISPRFVQSMPSSCDLRLGPVGVRRVMNVRVCRGSDGGFRKV